MQLQSRPMSDPILSDIGFKNKMARVWTTLKSVGPLMTTISELPTKWFQKINNFLSSENKSHKKEYHFDIKMHFGMNYFSMNHLS